MMSWQRAVNEIASLLTQGGTPSNHSQDIAARISFALEDYYNSRQAQGNNQDLNSGSANKSAFKDAFSSPEASKNGKGGKGGKAGKDGEYAWATGATGATGQDGTTGQDGYGQDGQDGQDGASGGGGLGSVPCKDLKKKLKDCGISTGGGIDGPSTCGGLPARYYDPVCCHDGDGSYRGQGVCDILKQQANQLKKIMERLQDIEDRLDAIEKILEDTVECPT